MKKSYLTLLKEIGGYPDKHLKSKPLESLIKNGYLRKLLKDGFTGILIQEGFAQKIIDNGYSHYIIGEGYEYEVNEQKIALVEYVVKKKLLY